MHDIAPTRRGVLRAGVGMAAGLSLCDLCAADDAPRRKPNILFIMDDQHRGDAIGAACGSEIVLAKKNERVK